MNYSTSLEFPKIANQSLKNAVFITGLPRSGTTLVGQLVSTLEKSEYYFEPPTFYALCCLYQAGEISASSARQLLEVYLYEDCFLESVLGRKVNLRSTDDSFFLNSKSQEELLSRWKTRKNRKDAQQVAHDQKARLVIKMPMIMNCLDFLKAIFTESKMIIVMRSGMSVVHSLVKKKWFENDYLQTELWPYQQSNSKIPVPYWVESIYQLEWQHWNVWTRAAYTWSLQSHLTWQWYQSQKHTDHIQIICYETLLKDKENVMQALSAWLQQPQTFYTKLMLKKIHHDSIIPLFLDTDLIADHIMQKFEAANRLWGYSMT